MDLFDIGVVTSVSSETISRVLLEYMFLHKPVIGTMVNAIGEIVQPGINGELIRLKDHIELSQSIKKILEDRSLRKAYGENSYRLYKKNYSEEIFYKNYIQVFKDITATS